MEFNGNIRHNVDANLKKKPSLMWTIDYSYKFYAVTKIINSIGQYNVYGLKA